MKANKLALASLLLAGLTGSSSAAILLGDVISVDFGSTAPSTANWNQVNRSGATTTVNDLVRLADGQATGVSVSITSSSAANDTGNGNGINNAQGSGSDQSSIYVDHVFGNGSTDDTLTITVSGLDDSLRYDLFGGYYRDNANADLFQTTTTLGSDVRVNSLVGGVVDGYETFTKIQSSGGVIQFTVTDNVNSGIATISELTITAVAVPEPSSTALLGLGGLALILRRRK